MKRFSIVEQGYNIDEVNNFIDIVIKKMEDLSETNNAYLLQLEEYKRKSANNKDEKGQNNTEIQVSKALIAAQSTADKMKELAREEADLIIKEARENANAIIHEALIDAQRKEQEYEILKKNYAVFRAKVESLVKAQLELLKNTED
ncbi:MAG: DivIVA domain-containing protein [Bacilli bacterium]|nr:DivIVA domain-containing protein [Bacilli bacterium]